MKTILPILLLCFVTCISTNAQGLFRFGLSVDGNMSGIHASDESSFGVIKTSYDLKMSYSIGGMLEYHFGKQFFLQTGVKWLNKGFSQKVENNLSTPNQFDIFIPSSSTPIIVIGSTGPPLFSTTLSSTRDRVDSKVIYNYIGIPIELKYRIGRNASAFYVLGGINQTFLVSQKVASTHILRERSREFVDHSTAFPSHTRFNTSFVFGLGYDLAVNSNCSLSLEPRFEWLPIRHNLGGRDKRHMCSYGLNASLWFR